MRCESCGNVDLLHYCASCGFVFCEGCLDMSDHEPRCMSCLNRDDGEEDEPSAAGVT
jgi:hypothetical protein